MILPKIVSTLVNNDANEALIELYLNEDLLWFKGHFDGFPILPALCQISMLRHFANTLFNLDITIEKIPRIKFLKIARPKDTIFLKLSLNEAKNTLTFDYFNKDKESYSKGTIKIC